MTRLKHVFTIARPHEEVWDYVMDPRNDPAWMANVVDVTVPEGEDPTLREGLEVRLTMAFAGVTFGATMRVTEVEPGRSSSVVIDGPVRAQGTWILEPVEAGTRSSTRTRTASSSWPSPSSRAWPSATSSPTPSG